MVNKELLAMFDGFSEGLLTVLSDGERMKKQVLALMEDNARLRLENQKLQEMIAHLQSPDTEKETAVTQTGKKYLENLYDEGFHVCNYDYGAARGTAEECLQCLELLYRDSDESTT